MVLTKELGSPGVACHRPLFLASTAPQDKTKINSSLCLTLPWFIYTYDNVTHLKIAMGLIGKLLSISTSGTSRRRRHFQQWLLTFFLFLPQPTVQNNFISSTCTCICKIRFYFSSYYHDLSVCKAFHNQGPSPHLVWVPIPNTAFKIIPQLPFIRLLWCDSFCTTGYMCNISITNNPEMRVLLSSQ